MAQQWNGRSSAVGFARGSLDRRVRATAKRARRTGALQPITTEAISIEDRGVQFLLRVVTSLGNKPAASGNHDPFSPCEESLYVADSLPSHVCVLNKFNVVDRHLLIVTREYEHQETALTERDFHALWRCLCEYESLGFYNSGARAGASQEHKHLQLVPLPLGLAVDSTQLTIRRMLDHALCRVGHVATLAALPFQHAYVCWDEPEHLDVASMAANALGHYRRLAQHVGIDLPRSLQARVATHYNLLISRRWMLLVPRILECFGDISLNSLAFCGAFLVRDENQLAELRQCGPWMALQSVCRPK